MDEDVPPLVEKLCQLCRCVVCESICVDAFHCANGHMTCRECLANQALQCVPRESVACAMCRNRGSWAQALSSKALLTLVEEDMGRPFVHCGHDGCSATLRIGELERHRTCCPHRLLPCPHQRCGVELPAREMLRHVIVHDNVVMITPDRPLTVFMTDCAASHIVVVEHGELDEDPPALFQLECSGAYGRAGSVELQQTLVRICCVTPSERAWTVTVQNRRLAPPCEVCETVSARVPDGPNVMTCGALASPMVLGDSDAAFADSVLHVGADVTDWWRSPKMRFVRQAVRPREDAFLASLRRAPDTPAVLLTFAFAYAS